MRIFLSIPNGRRTSGNFSRRHCHLAILIAAGLSIYGVSMLLPRQKTTAASLKAAQKPDAAAFCRWFRNWPGSREVGFLVYGW